jgi:hypothetical protein
MDQMIAKHVGQDTLLPSMVLACEQPLNGYHESNFSCAYSSHISWESPDSPMPNELYPSLALTPCLTTAATGAIPACSTASESKRSS